jgi:hypothetical protein
VRASHHGALFFGDNAETHVETNEKVERLLAYIRVKAEQLIVDDEEARW